MSLPSWLRRRRSATALLLAFGLGALAGYLLATGSWSRSAAYAAGLALGLSLVALWPRGLRAQDKPVPSEPRDAAAPGPGHSYDLRDDRSTDRQRFPM